MTWSRTTLRILLSLAGGVTVLLANPVTAAAPAGDWQNLLNATDLSQWRGYQQTDTPAGWQLRDGVLTRVAAAGDLITVAQFSDFELELDWRVAAGGNSGVFFHATETQPYIFMSAPEMQVLDDAAHVDGRNPLTSAGSNYALHAAPRGIVRGAGQWNEARLRVAGGHVQQWLNGVQIIDYQLGSDDWLARVAASKFSAWPAYGRAGSGHIGLQDHGDEVGFRNIRIRHLP